MQEAMEKAARAAAHKDDVLERLFGREGEWRDCRTKADVAELAAQALEHVATTFNVKVGMRNRLL